MNECVTGSACCDWGCPTDYFDAIGIYVSTALLCLYMMMSMFIDWLTWCAWGWLGGDDVIEGFVLPHSTNIPLIDCCYIFGG